MSLSQADFTLFQTLTFKLVAKVDDALKPDVIKWSAFYEHRIKMGTVSGSLLLCPGDAGLGDYL